VRLNPWNAAVAAIAASWGFVSVIVAGIDLSGETLVFWRCLLAALSLPVILLARGRLDALVPRRRRLAVLGLGLLLTLHWVLFFETIKRSSVAAAILLVYTAPIFLAVLAPLLLPERRSRVALVALGVSGPGIALIALAGNGDSGVSGIAVATGLGAALTYALLIIWTKSVVRVLSPFTVAFWDYVVVSLVLAPFLLGEGRVLPSAVEWPAVLVLGSVLTAVLGALYVRTLRDVTAQAAGLLRLPRARLGVPARVGDPGGVAGLGGCRGRPCRARGRRARGAARGR
jgi:drug/metabolite transporter (DMT)-like permease